MNLIKQAMKALAANEVDTTVAQVMEQADDEKLTKHLNGLQDKSLDDASRPQKQSAGVMAIWLMFKCYSILSTNEQIRRGDDYDAKLRAHGIVLKWVKALGNRELSWPANATVIVDLFLHPKIGVLHCHNCRARFEHFAQMLAPDVSVPDTSHLCVLCHNQSKFSGKGSKMKAVPLNKADKAVDGAMSNPQVLIECVVLKAVGGLLTVPALAHVQPLPAVDTYEYTRRLSSGLVELHDNTEACMNGSQRPLKDRVWAEWTFTAENDVDEDRACRIVFEEELRFVLQDTLAAVVANMPAGDAFDATLQAQKVAVEHVLTNVIVANWDTNYEDEELSDYEIRMFRYETPEATARVAPGAPCRFKVDVSFHIAPEVNYVDMLSEYMVANVHSLMQKVVGADATTDPNCMTAMHDRQSGAIGKEHLTKAKRRGNASAPSCNNEAESLLANVDGSLSRRSNQTTSAVSAVAVNQRNPARQALISKLMNPQTREACERDIEGCRLAGKEIVAKDKKRSAAIEKYDAVMLELKHTRRERLDKLKNQRLAATLQVTRVENIATAATLNETDLRAQFRSWDLLHKFAPAADRWKILLHEHHKALLIADDIEETEQVGRTCIVAHQ
jgi:hypothetical protein